MGNEKQTTEGTSSSNTRTQATAEEIELNKLLLERTKAGQGGMISAQQQGLSLVNALLAGGSLPGYLGALQQGITPDVIGQQGAMMAQKYGPGFQNLGISDSGTAFKETARGISNELLYPAQQFNIGNWQNLLNLALSGQAQVQQPMMAQTGILSSNLQGLRSTSTTGATSSTVTSMNPFLKSFQTSLGSTLGAPKFGAGPFSFGGS